MAHFFRFCIVLLMCTGALQAKRHSRENKITRYERRAQQAAKDDTSLSQALSKQTKFMTFDEAVRAQAYYRTQKHADMIIKCGERILAISGDQDVMRKTRIELAQLFLDKQNYTQAEKYAQEYLTHYPGSPESKQAAFIALNAAYQSQNSSYKDLLKKDTPLCREALKKEIDNIVAMLKNT